MVTADDADFLALARSRDDHAGIGLIDDQDTRANQIDAILRLARALLGHVARGGVLQRHVFVLRRTGRLAVREIPQRTGRN